MLLTYIKRGNAIAFTAEPQDANGEPVTPETVTLYVNYIDANDERTIDAMPMAETTAGEFEAEWDSTVAKEGRVHWLLSAVDGPDRAMILALTGSGPEAPSRNGQLTARFDTIYCRVRSLTAWSSPERRPPELSDLGRLPPADTTLSATSPRAAAADSRLSADRS